MKSPAQTRSPGPVAFLHRRYKHRLRVCRGVMSGVPLLDVLLVVGAFVVLNNWVTVRPAIPLELPVMDTVAGLPTGYVMITVTRDQWVFVDDQRLSLDQLSGPLTTAQQRAPGRDLLIQADRRVTQETLVQLYGLAQEAGFTSVWLATTPGDGNREALP